VAEFSLQHSAAPVLSLWTGDHGGSQATGLYIWPLRHPRYTVAACAMQQALQQQIKSDVAAAADVARPSVQILWPLTSRCAVPLPLALCSLVVCLVMYLPCAAARDL
jgi:hypothetical protein